MSCIYIYFTWLKYNYFGNFNDFDKKKCEYQIFINMFCPN